MSGRVPPSSKARVKMAIQAFEDFTGHKGELLDTVEVPEYDTCYVLGELTLIGYECTRDGELERYLHKFKKSARPLLCVSHDGEQLFIIDGNYYVNDAGINDR